MLIIRLSCLDALLFSEFFSIVSHKTGFYIFRVCSGWASFLLAGGWRRVWSTFLERQKWHVDSSNNVTLFIKFDYLKQFENAPKFIKFQSRAEPIIKCIAKIMQFSSGCEQSTTCISTEGGKIFRRKIYVSFHFLFSLFPSHFCIVAIGRCRVEKIEKVARMRFDLEQGREGKRKIGDDMMLRGKEKRKVEVLEREVFGRLSKTFQATIETWKFVAGRAFWINLYCIACRRPDEGFHFEID